MEVGAVFIWQSFPFSKFTQIEIKPRWFVYLGKTSIISSPIFVLLATTTTQLHHYERGGERNDHSIAKFRSGEFGFEQDCVLDVGWSFYADIPESVFIEYKADIDIKGRLPEQRLREIYNLILKSERIAKKVKKDIHHSFNMAGIEGLKKP